MDTFIKVNNHKPDVPVIMISALDDEAIVIEAVNVGAQDYLVKGRMDSNILGRSIRYAIERKKVEVTLRKAHDGLELMVKRRTADIKRAEEELRKFKFISDNSNDAHFLLERDAKFQYVNKAACEMFGYSENKFLTLRVPDVDVSYGLEKYQELFDLIQKEALPPIESVNKRKDGTVFPSEITVTGHKIDGKPYMFAALRDITMRKQAEEAFRRSEEKYRFMFTNMLDGFAYHKVLFDDNQIPIDYIFVEINDKFEEYTGLKRGEIVGKKVTEAIPGIKDVKPDLIAIYGKVAQTGEPVQFEIYFEPLNKYFLISSYCPQEGYFVALFNDITKRKLAEKSVEDEKNKAQNYLDIAAVIMVALDTEGKVSLINKKGCEILGYGCVDSNCNEIVGKDWFSNVLPEKIRDQAKDAYSKLIAGKIESIEYYENAVITKTGQERIIAWHNTLLKDNAGGIIGTLSSGEDITERKLVEEKVQFLSLITEQVSDAVLTTDLNFKITWANQSFQKLYGYSPEDILGQSPGFLNAEPMSEKIQKNIYQTVSSGNTWEGEALNRRKDGSTFPCELLIFPLLDKEGKNFAYAGHQRDITERKIAEKKLQFTQFAVHRASDAAYWMGADARFIYVNEAACRSLGYSQEELLTMTVHDISPEFPAEVWPDHWKELKERGSLTFETSHLAKDGRVFPVEITVNYLEFDGKEYNCAFARDITERKRMEETLQKIVKGTGNVTGKDFLRSLVKHLASLLGFRYVFVGELIQPDLERIRTVALWANGDYAEDIEYDLAGTPCENIIQQDFCIYPKNIQQLFPEDSLLAEMGVESYMGIPLIDSSGKAVGLLAALHDKPIENISYIKPILEIFAVRTITEIERKRAEEQLRKLYRAVEQSPETIMITDTKGVIEYVNPTFIQLTGYTPEEVLGKNPGFLKSGEQSPEFYKQLWDTIESGKDWRGEFHNQKKNGEYYWEFASISPVKNEEGVITHFVAVKEDITARKEAENALENALLEVEQLKNRLQAENIYLQDEIKLTHNFGEIIGQSKGLKEVLQKVEHVAPINTTVLILGETGTGKELFARAIHNTSERSKRPLVKVNCAALPSNLIESELFGHEKGAFTGAHTSKSGRFELADGGTIFLDEIGNLPLELQSKLLRVLQEGEFERLGSSRTTKVDVRIITATNRNLEDAVKTGDFREDLFYRLNVFPIRIPPLRERKDDIPILVNHFVKKFCAKTGKRIERIPLKTMDYLQAYHWPGNIRELENIIERAVVLNNSPTLHLDEFYLSGPSSSGRHLSTLKENERSLILKALEQTDWVIQGKFGAAMRLGLSPSTLRYRMKILDIKRRTP